MWLRGYIPDAQVEVSGDDRLTNAHHGKVLLFPLLAHGLPLPPLRTAFATVGVRQRLPLLGAFGADVGIGKRREGRVRHYPGGGRGSGCLLVVQADAAEEREVGPFVHAAYLRQAYGAVRQEHAPLRAQSCCLAADNAVCAGKYVPLRRYKHRRAPFWLSKNERRSVQQRDVAVLLRAVLSNLFGVLAQLAVHPLGLLHR